MLAEFDWNNLFSNPFGWLSIAVVAGVIGSIASSALSNWRKVRETEQLTALKQSMIDKGMSADDIVRVLETGRPNKTTC